MLKQKFNAKPVYHDGIRFPSRKEGTRYLELKALQFAGEVRFFQRQTPWHLPGGVKYLLDFQVRWADGRDTYEDIKGFKTPMYLTKKKMVEAIYGIKITEV